MSDDPTALNELAAILTRNTTTCLDSALVGSEYLARDIAEAVLAAGYVKRPSREAIANAVLSVTATSESRAYMWDKE
jgi:hypothetical protein